MGLKIKKESLFFLITLIPFLFPRGFSEFFPLYKQIYTIWLYLSIVFIFIYVFSHLRTNKTSWNGFVVISLLYFFSMGLITFALLGKISEGLQKVFAAPAICLLTVYALKRNSKLFVSSVLRITEIILCLNLLVFNQVFWGKYFNPQVDHLNFLGHVQITVQVCVIALLFSCINYRYFKRNKRRLKTDILIVIVSLLNSYTSASYLSLFVLFVLWIAYRFKFDKFLSYKGQVYLWGYWVLNIILLALVILKGETLQLLGLTLNGRGFIWAAGLDKIIRSPWYGYGVYGTRVQVFWSSWVGNGEGMNYMHNQVLQVLLDGGVILFTLYFVMLHYVSKRLNVASDSFVKYWSKAFFLVTVIVMLFESSMEYFYVFFILATISCLADIEKQATIY